MMDEEVKQIEETKVENADSKPNLAAHRIDSSRPLAGQVDKFLKTIPEEKEAEKTGEDETKTEEVGQKVETTKDDQQSTENAPDEVELEDIPEETKLEPLPEWQKYIVDNLPTIQVMGHQGEDGKDKVYNVKRLEELPDDFEFASKRAELAFNAALSAQELNARELLQQYKNEEAQRSQRDFEALEALDIQSDVTNLQKQGLLPKFKYAVNDPRFDTDPAVQESNKIYEFYKKINNDYFNKYQNSGRMYRVSYEDAAYRYYALHPKEVTPEIKKAVEKQETKTANQEQREKVASKIGAPQGASADGKRRALPHGTSINNVYQMYKRGII